MDLIVFLGVNVVLLVLLIVAFVLLRGSRASRRGDKSTPVPSADSKAGVEPDQNLDQVDATMPHRAASKDLVATNGSVESSGLATAGAAVSDPGSSNGSSSNGSLTNGSSSNGSPSNGSLSNGSSSNGSSSNGSANGTETDRRGAPFEVFTFDAARNGGRSLASLTTPGSGDEPGPDVSGDSPLFAVDRPAAEQPGSSIYLDAHLEGNRSARDVLVGKVIDELTPLGLTAERLTPSRSRLRSADGRTVAVTARALTADEDRIEIVLDTSLAGQVFTALRHWHRVDFDATDQMRLSARIR